MQLLHQLYQVGGSLSGLTHTSVADPFDDCNVYVLQLQNELVLFDCGNGETLEQIFFQMSYWGLDAEKISTCFLTHPHWDHAGAGWLLQQKGISLVAHTHTADALASGDERCCGFLYHKTFHPCNVDLVVKDKQVIEIDGFQITAHHFPGHTRGCTAYEFELENRRIFVTGDIIGTLGYGYFGWDGSIDFDKKTYLETLQKFSRIEFDVMLPGHGLASFYSPKNRVEDSLNQALIEWR